MKKRILIVSHAMEIGGAERALLGLLDSIDYTRFEVDLFLMRHTGELLPFVDPHVRLLSEKAPYACLAVPAKEVLRRGQIAVALGRWTGKQRAAARCRELGITGENMISLEYSHKFTRLAMPKISDTEYDLAISFLTPHYFVAEKVSAKKKIAWLHTDYSVVKVDAASEKKMWSEYDAVASISEQVGAGFAAVFPSLRDRLLEIGNIQPEKLIRAQAEETLPADEMPDTQIRLLSVGRYCTAKNFDNVPDICRRIRESGLDVKWYIIGFGGDEQRIREKIAESGMQEHVLLLGKKENPYPYIAACDLYVQPSRYEGKSVTVREAQLLGKPVVITKYATSASQLENGVDGVIVPMDNEGCANGIVNLLRDPERMKQLSENCKARDYSGRNEIEKIYKLME